METVIDPMNEDSRQKRDVRSDQVSFLLNGRRIVLTDIDPKTLLIDFLRSAKIGLTGTKLSCGEGGCGACTVALARKDFRVRRNNRGTDKRLPPSFVLSRRNGRNNNGGDRHSQE